MTLATPLPIPLQDGSRGSRLLELIAASGVLNRDGRLSKGGCLIKKGRLIKGCRSEKGDGLIKRGNFHQLGCLIKWGRFIKRGRYQCTTVLTNFTWKHSPTSFCSHTEDTLG